MEDMGGQGNFKSMIDFYKKDVMICEKDARQINMLINHLKKNKPVQYFFNYSFFKNLKLKVNSHVLIPRPETEELVDLIVSNFKQKNNFQIIDIGTGSGCISIYLKKKISANITALDYSKTAINLAKLNASIHNVDINFICMDIFIDSDFYSLPKYDLIVSNPPYVCESEVSKDSNIYYEPYNAIFVPNKNPLVYYFRICHFAKNHLNSDGRIYLEINHLFYDEIKKIFIDNGFDKVEIYNDFYGKKRFIVVYS